MRPPLFSLGLLSLGLLVLPGCRMNERMTGTAGGAVGGGLLGGVAAGTLGGVLIGATGGAIAGYLIGDYLADQRERGMTAQAAPSGGGGGGGSCGVPQYEVDTYASGNRVVRGSVSEGPPMPVTVPAAHPTASAPSTWAAKAAYERGRSAATAEEAKGAYEESIRLDPSRPEPWNALALHALATGDRATARAHLGRALALDPTYAPARLNLDRLERGL